MVDDDTLDAKTGYTIKVLQGGVVKATSGSFDVSVVCPTLTTNAISSTVTKYVPSSTAGSKEDCVVGTGTGGYVQTSSTNPTCAISGFALK